jgi:hypothetical protein
MIEGASSFRLAAHFAFRSLQRAGSALQSEDGLLFGERMPLLADDSSDGQVPSLTSTFFSGVPNIKLMG